MTYRISLLSVSLFALAPFAATADGVEYLSYGANYSNLSFDGDSIDLLGGNAAIDYRSGAFLVGGDLGLTNLSGDGDDITITDIAARAGYFVMPQLVVYGGIDSIDSSETSSFTSYNLGAEYMTGALTFGLNYNDSSEDGYIEATTIYASYKMDDTFEVALGVTEIADITSTTIGADFDNGQYDIAAIFSESDGVNIFGVSGSYEFVNSFRALAGYVNFDGEIDVFSVGAGYEVSQDLWIDLNIGQLSDGTDDIDSISLAVTYELGKETLLVDRANRVQIEALGTLGQIIELGGF